MNNKIEKFKTFVKNNQLAIGVIVGGLAATAGVVAYYERDALLVLTKEQAKDVLTGDGYVGYDTKYGRFSLFSTEVIENIKE